MSTYQVEISKSAMKDITKLPIHVKRTLLQWVESVELDGLPFVRKSKGYHDEPVKGELKGTRSIRLNAGYRAYYTEDKNGETVLVNVIRADKHKY